MESKLQCPTCVPRLTRGPDEPPHRYSEFMRLTNFTENAQKEVSDDVFQLWLSAEEIFVRHQNELLTEGRHPCVPKDEEG